MSNALKTLRRKVSAAFPDAAFVEETFGGASWLNIGVGPHRFTVEHDAEAHTLGFTRLDGRDLVLGHDAAFPDTAAALNGILHRLQQAVSDAASEPPARPQTADLTRAA